MKKIGPDFFKKFLARYARERAITISTMFTIARIVLTPFIVGAMTYGWWGVAFSLFVSASITDVIDGGLARMLDQRTALGACLDPIADKILLLSCFATLSFVSTPLFTIPTWFVSFVLAKELLLVGGVVLLYYMRGYVDVYATKLGKMTTLAQVSFIIWLFACYFFHWVPVKTYFVMLSVVTCMLSASLVQYGYEALLSEEEL